MKTANIATAKNQFSRLIARVKDGEAVLITERGKPVAQLQPFHADEPALEALHASGLLAPPAGKLDLATFCVAPRPSRDPSCSLSTAILAEREDARSPFPPPQLKPLVPPSGRKPTCPPSRN